MPVLTAEVKGRYSKSSASAPIASQPCAGVYAVTSTSSDLHALKERLTRLHFMLDSFLQPVRAIAGTRSGMPSDRPQRPQAGQP